MAKKTKKPSRRLRKVAERQELMSYGDYDSVIKTKEKEFKPRRHGDSTLMRSLEEHQRDSLSDIAEIWQRLTRLLGLGGMKFEERIATSSSTPNSDRALDTVASIIAWRNQCYKHGADSKCVMLLVTDGLSIASVARVLKIHPKCARNHIRVSLTIWSIWRKRCQSKELQIQLRERPAHCVCLPVNIR